MQQVGTDGDGEGFGRFGGFGFGFAFEDASDVLFAIKPRDEFVVEQKQFAVAVDIQRVAIGEFDTVVAAQRTRRRHTITRENLRQRIFREQSDFHTRPCVRWPSRRQNACQRLPVMPQHPLTGATPTRPDWRAVVGPASESTLARLRILIAEPAPGFHPQTPAQLTDDIAVRCAQHDIKQHAAHLILSRHRSQHFEQIGNGDPSSRLKR